MPTPVSNFPFTEGSGTFAASTIGGYTLSTGGNNPWVAGGIGVGGSGVAGAVGPNTSIQNWSASFEITLTAPNVQINDFFHFTGDSNSGKPWFNVSTARKVGPWSPDQFSATPLSVGQKYRVTFTFDATATKLYIDGVLDGTFAAYPPVNLNSVWIMDNNFGDLLAVIRSASFYDVTLTGAEVAALSAPPAQSILPSAIVSAEVVGAHVLSVGPVAVLPSAVASAEAVGTHTLTVGTPPAPVPPGTVPAMFGTPRTVGHAQYVGSMSADGYPGSPTFQPIQDRPSYGWYPLASEVPLGNDDYTQRVITSLVVGVPDVSPYAAGDLVVIAGEDYVVSEDVRDFTTGPFGRGPGGVVIVEKVSG